MSIETARALKKQLLIITEMKDETVIVNLKESPLRWLATRKDVNGQPYLEDIEILAGERFRQDFTFANLSPRMGVSFANTAVDNRSPEYFSDRVLASKERLNNARRNLGPELYSLAQDFLGFLMGLEECESRRSWSPRSGKIVVKLMLSHLARHYGLESSTTSTRPSR